MVWFIIYVTIAYLVGSVPTAIWYGRIFHKTDIRQHGSGNAGATNTVRTFGRKAGIIVLIIDIAKGALAVLLPLLISLIPGMPVESTLADFTYLRFPQLAFGLAGALGHIYPIYEKFKGGKGVATLFGVILALQPLSALFAVIVFVLIFIISKRVSLGSILSAWSFSIVFVIINHGKFLMVPDYVLVFIYPLLILYTHRSNVKRLLNGTEPKLSLGSKK